MAGPEIPLDCQHKVGVGEDGCPHSPCIPEEAWPVFGFSAEAHGGCPGAAQVSVASPLAGDLEEPWGESVLYNFLALALRSPSSAPVSPGLGRSWGLFFVETASTRDWHSSPHTCFFLRSSLHLLSPVDRSHPGNKQHRQEYSEAGSWHSDRDPL